MKLVDTHALGACGAILVGSSPTACTNQKTQQQIQKEVKMIDLDIVKVVSFHFRFSSLEMIPSLARCLSIDSTGENLKIYSRSGQEKIRPTDRCTLEGIIWDLDKSRFVLADASLKLRNDQNDPTGKKSYYGATYHFVRPGMTQATDKFKKMRHLIRTEFEKICDEALWQAMAFLNPLYIKGQEISGQKSVSISLNKRLPLFQADGQPVCFKVKGVSGSSRHKLPLRADYRLSIQGGAIVLRIVK